MHQALHEQAVILDAKEAAKGVPPPPADQKVTDGDVCPLSVHEIGQRLSPGAREELQSLKRMFAITFADKEGKKFVFQCREDYEQMLLKEANSNETYQFADLTAGGGHELAFSKDRCVRDTTDFLIANGIFHRSDVTLDATPLCIHQDTQADTPRPFHCLPGGDHHYGAVAVAEQGF